MNTNSSSYFRNFLTMLSGNTFSQLIPFLLAPILARIFSPVDFAVQANFMAIVGVIGIVATGRLELALPLPKEHNEAQDIAFTGSFITLCLGIASLLLPVFSVQIGGWYHDSKLAGYLWLAPVSVISIGLLGLANNWNLRQQQFKSISIGKIAQSLVNNVLAAALGYWGWGINGLLIAWLLSQYINIFILVAGVNRKVNRTDFNGKTIRNILDNYRDFPLINSLHAFTDVFVTQFLLFWLISTRFGQTELGLFAVMHKYVRAPIILISSSVSQLYYVEAGKAIQENRSAQPIMLRTLRTTVAFAIPFILIVLFFGPTLFQWYLGSTWTQAGEYARCITPMLLMTFLVSPISGTPILFKRQRSAFLFSLAGYGLSLMALLAALHFNLPFSASLWCYSGGYCLYQVALLVWYNSLIRRSHHAHID